MPMTGELLRHYLGLDDPSRPERVLRLLIELGAQVVGADEGSLLLVADARERPGGQELVFVMTLGADESERRLIGLRVPVGEGITGMAAMTGEVQIGGPAYRLGAAGEGDRPEGDTRSVMAAPMLIDDELVGVITAVTFRPDKLFTPDDARLYGRLAAVAGVVVDQQLRLQRSAADSAPDPREKRLLDAIAAVAGGDAARLDDTVRLLEIVARLGGAGGGEAP